MDTALSALAVLTDALERCRDEDMRTPQVTAALDFLAVRADRQWPFEQFRKALDDDNEEGRWQNLNASLARLPIKEQFRRNLERFIEMKMPYPAGKVHVEIVRP